MRWLRRTTPPTPRGRVAGSIEEVEALLRSAAAEVPPSRRAEEIRAAVLEDVASERGHAVPGLAPLALAFGALLLALAIGVGAPVVGSFIGTLLERIEPGPSDEMPSLPTLPSPSIDDAAEVPDLPMPTDLPTPTRDVPAAGPSSVPAGPGSAGGSAGGAGDEGAPIIAPTTPQPAPPAGPPVPTPTPTPTPEAWRPGEPPVPVPTPPETGPPPRSPGG